MIDPGSYPSRIGPQDPGCPRRAGIAWLRRLLLSSALAFQIFPAAGAEPETTPSLDSTNPPPAQPTVPAPSPDTQPAPTPSPEAQPTPAPGPEPAASTHADASLRQNAQGKTLYSFRANNLELKASLALFARANGLNVVPDPDVTGSVTLDVQDLPLEQMMEALLEANDYSWTLKNGLIRIRSSEMRMFHVDYLRLTRKGTGQSSATLASGSGGGSGSSGGSGGGGGGGGSSGGGMGGSSGSSGGAGGGGGSAVNLQQDNDVDFWKELREEISHILTAKGKETLAINMTAGIIQVQDRPGALLRLESYLNGTTAKVHRQVDIEAKLYDVVLNDQFQLGIDWTHVIKMMEGTATTYGATTVAAPLGGESIKSDAFGFIFKNKNTDVAVQALQEQGQVEIISKPRIRTLNNQTALIKVGTDRPFFRKTTTYFPGTTSTTSTAIEQDEVTTITVGTILAITPQISTNSEVTMDISPVLTSLAGVEESGTAKAPILNIKQASSIVRVPQGNTVVLGGLIENISSKTQRKVPLVGDIPLLGKIFQGQFKSKSKRELVIFVTPTIVD